MRGCGAGDVTAVERRFDRDVTRLPPCRLDRRAQFADAHHLLGAFLCSASDEIGHLNRKARR